MMMTLQDDKLTSPSAATAGESVVPWPPSSMIIQSTAALPLQCPSVEQPYYLNYQQHQYESMSIQVEEAQEPSPPQCNSFADVSRGQCQSQGEQEEQSARKASGK